MINNDSKNNFEFALFFCEIASLCAKIRVTQLQRLFGLSYWSSFAAIRRQREPQWHLVVKPKSAYVRSTFQSVLLVDVDYKWILESQEAETGWSGLSSTTWFYMAVLFRKPSLIANDSISKISSLWSSCVQLPWCSAKRNHWLVCGTLWLHCQGSPCFLRWTRLLLPTLPKPIFCGGSTTLVWVLTWHQCHAI